MNTSTNQQPLRQCASVEQLHEQRHGATRITIAGLNHADVAPAVVAEAQTRGETGLRKPGPLADGFERGGRHSEQRLKSPVRAFVAQPFVQIDWVTKSEGRALKIGKIVSVHPVFHVAHENVSRGFSRIGVTDHVGVAGVVVENCDLGHVILPCPVGKRPVADALCLRNNVPVVNTNRTRFVANYQQQGEG